MNRKHEEIEIPVGNYNADLSDPLGDTTPRELIEDSYGEPGEKWQRVFAVSGMGVAALAAVLVTSKGIKHFRTKYPDEAID